MIIPFNELASYNGNEIKDRLDELCLTDIFDELIPLFKDDLSLSQAIKYIVLAYTKDSNCVVLGIDWLENKKRVFDKSFLHKDYYNDFVLLQNRIVVKTIQKWVNIQDSNVWSNLCSLKDLLIEMRLSCNSEIRKSSGEIDYSQKYLNATYVQDLGKMIKDLEAELIQNDPKFKEAIKEFKKVKAEKVTMGAESFAN